MLYAHRRGMPCLSLLPSLSASSLLPTHIPRSCWLNCVVLYVVGTIPTRHRISAALICLPVLPRAFAPSTVQTVPWLSPGISHWHFHCSRVESVCPLHWHGAKTYKNIPPSPVCVLLKGENNHYIACILIATEFGISWNSKFSKFRIQRLVILNLNLNSDSKLLMHIPNYLRNVSAIFSASKCHACIHSTCILPH